MIGERLGSYQVLRAGPRERLERALADARGASALRHASIVEVLEVGVRPAGEAYVVMELLAGPSLRERMAQGPSLSIEELRLVTSQIAVALGADHSRRISHGALKPENVFLVEGRLDRVKVTDYGMARLWPELPAGMSALGQGAAYLSPERCRGAAVMDVNDDVYALGCLMFEMACGRVPFPHTDVPALMAAHLAAPLPPPRTLVPALPPALDRLIVNMLARSPSERPVSMRAVVERLAQSAGDEPPPRPAPRPVVSPRLTPLGHAHIRPTEERMIPSMSGRITSPRRTPLGEAHLHLRDLIVEDDLRATGISGVQEGPAPPETLETPPVEAPTPSKAKVKISRRGWMVAGILGLAAGTIAVARALRKRPR